MPRETRRVGRGPPGHRPALADSHGRRVPEHLRGPKAPGNGPHVPWPSPGAHPPSQTETGAPRICAGVCVMSPLETILLATDGSAASESASEQAIDLAVQVQARLLVVSVLVS